MRRGGPVRTCVGCGARDAQAVLRRFVGEGDGLRLDARRRAPGRGAYLHARAECWDAFLRRRGPIRSLRRSIGHTERARLITALRGSAAGEAAR